MEPGETKYFDFPQHTEKLVISVGNKQILVFDISAFVLSSKTIILGVLVVLTLLFFLIYRKANIDKKSKLF